ncbi:MAG: maltose alpha-D-glucosyltransferase [Methanothrix sp.]|nr:maltose alpha-D-glucosyltransferase [Methanothrix sp.]
MSNDYIRWLEKQSMLYQSKYESRKVSGSNMQWKYPYGLPIPKTACLEASVWFTAYPASTITCEDETFLQAFGHKELWKIFKEIGIEALHTGPLRRAGGISGYEYTPSIDGGFDRISYEIDPAFGGEVDFIKMVKIAKENESVIIDDLIPGHTGKGADFLLATLKFKDYPGMYHMVEISKNDWDLLPEVRNGEESINLPKDVVEKLKNKGYIVGELQRVIFQENGVKESNWDATKPVLGIDGMERRWVYLHYFKSGQPTLNWLDPSFAANRMISGEIIKSLKTLGAKILRLDANGFLGVEIDSDAAWSEGNPIHQEYPHSHPLSVIASNTIAMLVRKLGGFTFQELNLSVDAIKSFSYLGADLSYDFITRTAYVHAIITKDTEFLRLMLGLMHKYGIKPNSLIHALQNHDEMTLELVHFCAHPDDFFVYHGEKYKGRNLRKKITGDVLKIAGNQTPYNLKSGNGLCTTVPGICAAAIGIKDPYNITSEKKNLIKKMHLLALTFNAMQPGVFALSGWDLVGALPLPVESVRDLIGDKDYRWVNRGAYDLMGVCNEENKSKFGIPKAHSLYGSLPHQLKDQNSFVSQLKKLLILRKNYKISLADQIAIPNVENPSVLIMVHVLSDNLGIEITALNFGDFAVREEIDITKICQNIKIYKIINLLDGTEEDSSMESDIVLNLKAFERKIILIINSI